MQCLSSWHFKVLFYILWAGSSAEILDPCKLCQSKQGDAPCLGGIVVIPTSQQLDLFLVILEK